MKKDKAYFEDIQNKIVEGMKIAFDKLVIEKAAKDQEFVFSKDGKIYTVKAKDLLKK
ncbi:MAG: hypothetical protein WCL14_04585 [Bacteroidota bacterium]